MYKINNNFNKIDNILDRTSSMIQRKTDEIMKQAEQATKKNSNIRSKDTVKITSTIENISTIAKGTVPNTTVIRPLPKTMTVVKGTVKDKKTKIVYKRDFIQDNGRTKLNPKGNFILGVDRPHEMNGKEVGYHINTAKYNEIMNSNLSKLQKWSLNKLSHIEIPKPLFNVFRKINGTVVPAVKFGGKALGAFAIASDAYRLSNTIYRDLNDTDRRIGLPTYKSIASIGGSWAGAYGGAKLGTMGGIAIGNAICPGLGTVIGGFFGGLIGGIAGSYGGSAFGSSIISSLF